MAISLLAIVLLTGACISPSEQPIRSAAMRTEAIRVDTIGGATNATAADAAIELRLAGRIESGSIVAVFEPKSGAFWWVFEVTNPSVAARPAQRLTQTTKFHLVDGALVAFRMNGRFLGIRPSRERVKSLEEGMKAAGASLERSAREVEAGTKEWFTKVDLSSLGRGFFLRSGQAATLDPPVIRSVAYAGGQWTITLAGPNGDTAVVNLDSKYSVMAVRKQQVALPPATKSLIVDENFGARTSLR